MIPINKDSEKYLERKLREEIERLGGKALKFSSAIDTGLPDRIVLLPYGKTFFVEIKSKGRKPRKLQALRHEELRRKGFPVFVVDCYAVLEIVLNALRAERGVRV